MRVQCMYSVWKGSPLRKRRKLLEEMLLLAEQGERNSSSQQYSDMGGDMGGGGLDGADEHIRRGIDLIEKYSVAPTVEALEKAMASIASTPKAPSWRCHSLPPFLVSWGRLSRLLAALLCALNTAHALGTHSGRAAKPCRAPWEAAMWP